MNLNLSLKIISKKNALFELYNFLKNNKFKKICFVIDDIFFNDKKINKLISKIKNNKIKIFKFRYNNKFEPSYEYLEEVRNKISQNFDLIIALGGGSTIDFAKGLAIVLSNHKKSIFYRGFPKKVNTPINLIAIPTTPSTGSDVSYNAVFTEKKTKTKMGINYLYNYPILSIHDTYFMEKADKKIIFNSICASLVRSIESYYSKNSNSISKILSVNSLQLIVENFENYLKKKKEFHGQCLLLASSMSMTALANSGGGLGGVPAYYLSANYNIPQSIGYSISGFKIILENYKIYSNSYLELEKEISLKKGKKFSLIKYIKNLEKMKNKLNYKYFLPNDIDTKLYELIYIRFGAQINQLNLFKLKKNSLKRITKNIKKEFI